MPQYVKTFRVFVSSTFSDMQKERGLLQKDVFPMLEKFCEENGARFQAIDLRWGVNEQIQFEQKTMQVCLNEIYRCQSISPKPNFLILLGDRYGWQPLPEVISIVEMLAIESVTDKSGKDLLNTWYQRDENAVPCEYLLKSRIESEKDWNVWSVTENSIRQTLRNAVNKLNFSEEQQIRYFSSATHQEIIQGALNHKNPQYDPREHVLACFRKLESKTADNWTNVYRDMLGEKTDEYSETRLTKLKTQLRDTLPGNIYDYTACMDQGTKDSIENSLSFDEKGFCSFVYNRLRSTIEGQLREFKAEDDIQRELRCQHEYRQALIRDFVGRRSELGSISLYITSKNEDKVLVITGDTGIGKSSLIARASFDSDKPGTVQVCRFIGITPGSSDIGQMIGSICSEIALKYGSAPDVPSESVQRDLTSSDNSIKEQLAGCFSLASEEKPLVVFIDGFDQLPGESPLRLFFWLPKTLSQHVRLVISALPEQVQGLARKEALNVPPMSGEEVHLFIGQRLQKAGRRLTADQMQAVRCRLEKNATPVYMHHAMMRVKNWTSFRMESSLPDTLEGLFKDFSESLETTHTRLLTSTILSYLLSGKYSGLAETDLLNLLPEDAGFWEAFLEASFSEYRDEVRKLRKLPIVLWSRLYLDIEPYLSERSIDDRLIITIFNKQFADFLKKRYCSDETHTHISLAAYFLKKADPAGMRDSWRAEVTMGTGDSSKQEASADPGYSGECKESGGPCEPWCGENRYELNVLAFHLGKALESEKLLKILSDPFFIDKRCEYGDIYRLLEDYSFLDNREDGLVHKYKGFLSKNAQRLGKYPGMFPGLTLHEGFDEAKENLTRLIVAGLYRKEHLRTKKLSIPYSDVDIPESEEGIEIIGHYDVDSRASAISGDGRLIFFMKKLGQIALIDSEKMTELNEGIEVRKSRILSMFSSRTGEYLILAYENGEADLIRISHNSDQLTDYSLLEPFRYYLPEYEKPVMYWESDRLIYQKDYNIISLMDPSAGIPRITDYSLPENCRGELSGVACLNLDEGFGNVDNISSRRILSLRRCDETVLAGLNEIVTYLFAISDKDVRCLKCQKTGHVVIAFTDRTVMMYRLASPYLCEYSAELQEISSAIWLQEDKISVVTDKGNYFEGTLNVKAVLKPKGNIAGQYSKGLITDFTVLDIDSNGNMYALSDKSFVSFRLIQAHSHSSVGEIIAVRCMKEDNFLAVVESHGKIIACQSKKTLASSDSVNSGLSGNTGITIPQGYFYAFDGSRNLLSVSLSGGRGTFASLDTGKVSELTNLPHSITSVASSNETGFWLADTGGNIFYLDGSMHCIKAANTGVDLPRGAVLYSWPGLLVWKGLCNVENDLYTAVVFYLIENEQNGMLARAGKALYRNEDGFISTTDFDPVTNQVFILLQQGKRFKCCFRYGSPEMFVRNQEKEIEIKGLNENIVSSRFSCNADMNRRGFFLLSQAGNLFWVDNSKMTEALVAGPYLSPGTAFSGVAEGHLNEGVIVRDRRSDLYKVLKEGGHV